MLPATARYIDRLSPEGGLDAYPDYRAKASLYRSMLQARPVSTEVSASLPPPLRGLVEQPVPVSSWIPEVHSHAVLLVVYDVSFGSLDRLAEFAYAQQRSLFAGRLYSAALRLVSPGMLIKGASMRWKAFHRGTQFSVVSSGDGEAVVRLEHPRNLYDEVSRTGMREGLRAALDVSRAGGAEVVEVEATDTHALVRATWRGHGG